MSTPHNQANMGDIARIVLMPGDPLRAKFIAEKFLENPVQFNSVRNMFGFTGTYKGKKISVMGSGMGIPSMGIYSYELFNLYGVEKIIRIGSTGAYKEDLALFDTFLVESCYSESTFAMTMSNIDRHIEYPDPELNKTIEKVAAELNIPLAKGRAHSSDAFYHGENVDVWKTVKENDLCVAEMESFGLFHVANVLGKKAACLLTVSDSIINSQETTSEERQVAFVNMMKVALEAAIADE